MRQWVREGCGLAELQRRIAEEYDTTMTYMDVRFLVVDLGVEIQEAEESQPKPAAPAAEAPPAGEQPAEEPEVMPPAQEQGGGAVSVEVDRLMKPGALVSGSVTFSDGVTATWMLDQFGRLAIDPSQPDYRPSEADNEAFVTALQQEIAKKGF